MPLEASVPTDHSGLAVIAGLSWPNFAEAVSLTASVLTVLTGLDDSEPATTVVLPGTFPSSDTGLDLHRSAS